LLVAKLKLKLKQRRSTKQRAQTFDDGKFKQPGVKMAFDIKLSNRFAVLETADSVEWTWINFRNTVVQAAEKVVGYGRGTKKERWISDDTWKVIDERKQRKSQGQLTKEQLTDLEQKRIQSKRQGGQKKLHKRQTTVV